MLRDHDTMCVPRAADALAAIRGGTSFDIIFCDLMMPDMTGLEFYDTLLRTRPLDAHRVAFLTGGAVTGRASEFLASVANMTLEKPFELRQLQSLVQRLLAAVSPAG